MCHLTSSSRTCMWSGTIGIGLARGHGSANALSARVLRGVRISRGTVRTRRLLNDPGFVGQKDPCVVCVYAFAVVIIPTIIHASVLLCCYCRCHVVSILDWVVNIRMCSAFSSCIRFHCSLRCPIFDCSVVGRGWMLCGPAIGNKSQLISSFHFHSLISS